MLIRINSEDAGNQILSRDSFSKGIVNQDRAAYNQAIAQYKIAKAKADNNNHMEERMSKLESDVTEIKDMLKQLLYGKL